MSFKQYWARQFGKPTGFGGKIASFIMNRFNGKNYEAVMKQAPKSGKILEIGFGNGYLIKKLVVKTDAIIYGIDISKDMVSTAIKRNKKAIKDGRAILTMGAVENIITQSQFDFIYTVNTVYFWKDLKSGLLAIREKLKDGGIFMNVLFTNEFLNRHSYTQYGFVKYEPKELINAAIDIGLNAEIIETEAGKSFYILATK